MRHLAIPALFSALLAPALPALAQDQTAAAEQRAVVFDVELYDTSGEGSNPALEKRIDLVSDELRRLIDASPKYAAVDLAPEAEHIASLGPLYKCNGCERDVAKALDGDVSFIAVVHKISTLILKIQIVGQNVATGEVFTMAGADIRGDNDESWLHGVRWLARNKLDL
ncbi:DUF3280 domain-containing protein [Indioceanicola profundi]|uniref:DUF3280 domain-containing protein n=1 Tax=Indioceanicola profundi TaxID=2220096 RepID=UPI000E6AD03D|nr:DUF3280 domain-containing protein [Indioceanicola profundi]